MDPWKLFVSLGVPGLALGIFYMLFRTFEWEFQIVPSNWVDRTSKKQAQVIRSIYARSPLRDGRDVCWSRACGSPWLV